MRLPRLPAYATCKTTFGIALLQNFNCVSYQSAAFRNYRNCLANQTPFCTNRRSCSSRGILRNLCHAILIRSSSNCTRTTKEMLNHLPYFASGEIVRGFGRGSSELGIPTANFSLDVVKALPSAFTLGIYYGWANVDNGEVYKMVMSIGMNPYYDNKEKSMETHILHKFDGDLYGRLLKVCIVGYLRPERNFDSLEDLIHAIRSDIAEAEKLLDSDDESRQLKLATFFQASCNDNTKSTTTTNTTHLNGDNLKNGS